ncbi:PKD domain-containing protein [Acidobacteriota bacterium]
MKKIISSFISVALFLVFFLVLSTSAYSQDPHEFILKWGSFGYGDGEFFFPHDIAIDSDGYVYVADMWNYRIQKFDSDGGFIGWWGLDNTCYTGWHDPPTGSGILGVWGTEDGQFKDPRGVAVDSEGYVYVSDMWNHRIQKFTSDGVFLGWWGRDNTGYTGWHDPGTGTWGVLGSGDGQFYFPHDIAIDSEGYVYVSDIYNYRIQKFTSDGVFLGWWGRDNTGYTGWHDPGSGTSGDSGSGDGQFDRPHDIAVDSDGYVYVADMWNWRIQKFDSDGGFIGWWGLDNTGFTGWHGPGTGTWGVAGTGDGQLHFPHDIAIDSDGYVYVSDPGPHRIQKFTSGGVFLGWWGADSTGYTGWHDPGTGTWGTDGSGDGQFDGPRGIAVDSDGYVYVADMWNDRIQKFGPAHITVNIDIKPGSCPNPLNLESKGVLPVAVLGTEDFDVTVIDPETIVLAREGYEDFGVSPIRWNYEDVATPFEGELCDCHDLNEDGFLDLTLKFKTKDLVQDLLLAEETGNTIPLTLTGNLTQENDGTQIRGSDCIKVMKSGRTNPIYVMELGDPDYSECGGVTINGVVLTFEGDVTHITWDWGDGTIFDSWFPASHSYLNNGDYDVKVTAYTDTGWSRTVTASVTIPNACT